MVALKPISLSLAVPNQSQKSTTPLASPAATLVHANPPLTNERRSNSFGGLGAALKKSTSFKTSSTRPPSDSNLPPRSAGHHGQPRSKSMLPLSRGSSRPATPSGTSTPSAGGSHVPNSLSGLEESYVTKASMKMLEAVNKTFALHEAGTFSGRPVPSWRRAKELGDLIEAELRAAEHDPYFFRTMLRSAVLKTLSLFLSRLSPIMTPAPPFSFPLSNPLPAGLQYTLVIARCAAELRDSLDACRGLCGDHSLQGWSQKLDDVVNRLVSPVVSSIKADISSLSVVAHEPAIATPPPTTKGLMSRSTHSVQPVGAWSKQLAAIFEGANRILVEAGECGFKGRVQIATVAVWKFSLNFAARDLTAASSPTAAAPAAKNSMRARTTRVVTGKKSPSPPASPPLDPSVVAPPSPPNSFSGARNETNAKLIQEIVAFEQLVKSFVAPLDIKWPAPAQTKEQIVNPACECALCATGRTFPSLDAVEENDLAKAAMLEALAALSALIVVTSASYDLTLLERALDAQSTGARWTPSDVLGQVEQQERKPGSGSCPTLSAALVALPDLLLAHVVMARMHLGAADAEDTNHVRPPHVLFGMKWASYVAELKGFRNAEEWTPEIFDDLRDELDRVLEQRGGDGKPTPEEIVLRKVLDASI